jgi:hypothetical protein
MNIDVIEFYNKASSIALALPRVIGPIELRPSRSTKKCLRHLKEDGKTLVVYTEERNKWMKQDPGTFFITDHYKT